MAKIIGKTKDGLLIEMSNGEIGDLAGWCRFRRPEWIIGQTFNPSELYNQMDSILANKEKQKDSIAELRQMADSLEKLHLPNVIFELKKQAK